MNSQELAKRNGKANQLKVFQVDDGQYYVESSEGKICYKVTGSNGTKSCSCGDFTKNKSKTPQFACKHILAVVNSNGNLSKVTFLEKEKPKLNERFITNIKGKDFVIYAGLLDLAHQKGIKKLFVEALQYPAKENGFEAICKTTIESIYGEMYVEWGDANPKNVNQKVAAHILRMAATRAKARALRDFTNIGITCLEELGDLNEVFTDDKVVIKSPNKVTKHPNSELNKPPQVKSKNSEKKNSSKSEVSKSDKPELSDAQKKAIENLAKRRGIFQEELEEMAKKQFGRSLQNITSPEAATFIRSLQQSA